MIIAIANQKGGVGKTTTTAALAVNLSRMGHRVLAVDADPQANLTNTLGITPEQAASGPNLFTVMEGVDAMADALRETTSGVWIIPAHISLAHSERSLNQRVDRERILSRLLRPVLTEFDAVLLDSPPSLGIFAYNALAACDTVLVPMQCEPLALDGLTMLLNTLEEVRSYELNPKCELGGIALTMYDGRRNIDKRVVSTIVDTVGDLAFSSLIPRDVRLVELTETGDVSLLSGDSNAAVAYRMLAEEVANRWLE